MSPRPFSYDGKRVIVTGAASGMGAATVALLAAAGAETYALDVAPVDGPVARAFETDCGDPASIDAALDAIGAPVHCVFNVAGVPQTHAARAGASASTSSGCATSPSGCSTARWARAARSRTWRRRPAPAGANHLAAIKERARDRRLRGGRGVGGGEPRRAGRPVPLLEGVRRRLHDAARPRAARPRASA